MPTKGDNPTRSITFNIFKNPFEAGDIFGGACSKNVLVEWVIKVRTKVNLI